MTSRRGYNYGDMTKVTTVADNPASPKTAFRAPTRECESVGPTPVADAPADPGERAILFGELAERWRRETGMLSSLTKKIQHPAYQKIIEMGAPVVPLILQEMRVRPAYWFAALESITKTSPIDRRSKVDLAQATALWLAWGKKAGHVE